MNIFVFGLILLVVGVVTLSRANAFRLHPAEQRLAILGAAVGGVLIGLAMIGWSTAVYVNDNQGGVVIVKFGADLPSNRIIASEGEKGPQAVVLPPGWHFFYWPWIYDLETVDNIDIPRGKIGVVTARDGRSLPEGTVYAPAMDADRLLDAQFFLGEGSGYRGPQLTVLTPGQYRYNPRLYTIELRPVLSVSVGEVAVIKADAGPIYDPGPGEEVETVNGTPIVPSGYRGIWREALTPNAYYLHPDAYVVTRVQTTNRMYEYAHAQALTVRTRDGFEFPVDVRVSAKISAIDAPYVVAKLADPDRSEGRHTTLEERVILPAIRAIFRNTAETRNALEFVRTRSDIERLATEMLREGLAEYRVDTEGVFIADIRIAETEAGRRLLATQTDREVAQQEQETFREQQRAQVARAEAVRSEEEANQQIQQAQARARVEIARQDAQAMIATAEGEAAAYRTKMAALEGIENFIRLELAQMIVARWGGEVPRVFTIGGGNDSGSTTLTGAMLQRLLEPAAEAAGR